MAKQTLLEIWNDVGRVPFDARRIDNSNYCGDPGCGCEPTTITFHCLGFTDDYQYAIGWSRHYTGLARAEKARADLWEVALGRKAIPDPL